MEQWYQSECKQLAQGHVANEYQRQDLNGDRRAPVPLDYKGNSDRKDVG